MPEFDVLLVLFPAKENFFAADDGREIDQSAVEVFNLDLAALEFMKEVAQFREQFDLLVDGFAACVHPAGKHLADALVELLQLPPELMNLIEPFANLRNERTRFVD